MRDLVFASAVAIALALGGAAAWKAEASAAAGALPPVERGMISKPIHPAACDDKPDKHCPPRTHWVCGPYGQRCWCTPC